MYLAMRRSYKYMWLTRTTTPRRPLLCELESPSEFKLLLGLLVVAPLQGDPVHRLHHVRRGRRGEGGGREGGVRGGRRLCHGPWLPDHLGGRLFLRILHFCSLKTKLFNDNF